MAISYAYSGGVGKKEMVVMEVMVVEVTEVGVIRDNDDVRVMLLTMV